MIVSSQPLGQVTARARAANGPVPHEQDPDTVERSIPGKIKDALLDGVRATSDFLERHPLANGAVQDAFAISRGLHAFPKFIYPTITGATPAEHDFILETLDQLPLKDVNSVKSIEVVPDIEGASGRAFRHTVTNHIELNREQISISPEWFREVLKHEVGHTKDYASSWFNHSGLGNHSSKEPWGEGPYVTEYSGKSHYEDYAEAYSHYHEKPEQLRAANEEKYRIIEEHEKNNFMERLIDREEFRETGKWLGEHMAPTQGIRTGMEVFYWATGGVQLIHGWDLMRQASETDDPHKHMSGVLNMVSGAMFATQLLAVGGLMVQGAHRALNQGIRRGEITAADGDSAVRVVSDPLEKGVRFVTSKLGLTDKFEKLELNSPHSARAGAIATGGALGSLVGGMAGPYGGLMLGYHIAGPVGGAIGLVAGALTGYAVGSTLGGRAGGALSRALGG